MSINLHWFLTTAGDGHSIVGGSHLGFTAALTPTGTRCEDTWLTTAALIPETRRLDHVLAVARVESGQHPDGAHQPLVWHDGGFAVVG